MCVTTEWRSRSYIYKTTQKLLINHPSDFLWCVNLRVLGISLSGDTDSKRTSLSLSLLSHSLSLSSLSFSLRHLDIYIFLHDLSLFPSISLSLTYTCRYIFLPSVYQCLSLPFSLRDFLSHIHIQYLNYTETLLAKTINNTVNQSTIIRLSSYFGIQANQT